MYTFDTSSISSNLLALGEKRRIAFGVFLLERAFPGFLQFQIDTGYAGGGELRAALAQVWYAIEMGALRLSPFVTPSDCDSLMPNSESCASPYTSAAIDAISIAFNLLSYLECGDLDLLLKAAGLRRDTIDLFIQNNTDISPLENDFEKKMVAHPLMQEELRFIHDDLVFLMGVPENNQAILVAALERVSRLGYGKLRLKI